MFPIGLVRRCLLCFFGFIFLMYLPGCNSNFDERLVPEEWQVNFHKKTLGQISQDIGMPTESSSVKQFQNWVQINPSGFKMLKIICPLRCDSSEAPVEVIFLVYKNGSASPIYSKDLLHSEVFKNHSKQ